MRKTLFGLLLFCSTLFAEVIDKPATVEFIKNPKMKIIDIRTEGEWVQIGVIKNSILLTFFDEHGGVNTDLFLEELNKVVDRDEEFAIICNTGSRTKLVSNYLGKKLDYKVVNLVGGITKLLKDGFEIDSYERATENSTK